MQDAALLAQAMRDGLRRFAKAVVVITCRQEGRRYAMAATAVSELSLDPPSMLICVNRNASIHAPLFAGADYCINILHSSHDAISALCSGGAQGEARFDQGEWAMSEAGPPYLIDAQANFICRQRQHIAFGTHGIFIGEVVEARTSGAVDPLVYVDGRYTTVRG